MNVYLDHAATTPIDPRVLEKMLPYMKECFGNASSSHGFGRVAAAAVDDARGDVADLLHAKSQEIFFTSGGTESDNWAIYGVAHANVNKGKHIVTTTVEHPAVLNAMRRLEREGYRVSYVPVGSDGRVCAEEIQSALRNDTILVSVMYVNNETGVIMPIPEIGKICRQSGVIFHSDAVQAAGCMEMDVDKLCVDLCSVSAHKFYGPKGVGALYVRNGVSIEKLVVGGHQERGYRAGTTNVAGAIGLAEALKIATAERERTNEKIKGVRDYFLQRVLSEFSGAECNGSMDFRVVSNANIRFGNVDGQALLVKLDRKGIAVSNGAACNAGSVEPSYVIKALGVGEAGAKSSIRFTFGKDNTQEEADYVADVLREAVDDLRESALLWKPIEGKKTIV